MRRYWVFIFGKLNQARNVLRIRNRLFSDVCCHAYSILETWRFYESSTHYFHCTYCLLTAQPLILICHLLRKKNQENVSCDKREICSVFAFTKKKHV